MKVTKMEADANKQRERERDWKRERGGTRERARVIPLHPRFPQHTGLVLLQREGGGGEEGERREGRREVLFLQPSQRISLVNLKL